MLKWKAIRRRREEKYIRHSSGVYRYKVFTTGGPE
jgi:hypothetical protein